MEIYYVTERFESDVFLDDVIFYAKLEGAEKAMNELIARKQAQHNARYESSLQNWRLNHKAMRNLIDANLPLPLALLNVTTTPPEARPFNHSYIVEVMEVVD